MNVKIYEWEKRSSKIFDFQIRIVIWAVNDADYPAKRGLFYARNGCICFLKMRTI